MKTKREMALKIQHSKDYKTGKKDFKYIMNDEKYPYILAGESSLEARGFKTTNYSDLIFVISDQNYKTPFIKYYNKNEFLSENFELNQGIWMQSIRDSLKFIEKHFYSKSSDFMQYLKILKDWNKDPELLKAIKEVENDL